MGYSAPLELPSCSQNSPGTCVIVRICAYPLVHRATVGTGTMLQRRCMLQENSVRDVLGLQRYSVPW